MNIIQNGWFMRQEEWESQCFVDETEADLEDLLAGRIKDVEHLEELKKLLEKLDMMSANAESLTRTSDKVLYDFVNSKSPEEFREIHAKLDEYNKWFENTFAVFMDGANK